MGTKIGFYLPLFPPSLPLFPTSLPSLPPSLSSLPLFPSSLPSSIVHPHLHFLSYRHALPSTKQSSRTQSLREFQDKILRNSKHRLLSWVSHTPFFHPIPQCVTFHFRIISVGFFGSLIIQWYNWKVLVFLVGCMSLGWTVCLQLFSSSHHKKMQYRLSDSIRPPTSRLKLHIQPSSLLASCRSVPWKELLSHSSVM